MHYFISTAFIWIIFFFVNAEHRKLPAFLFYIFNAQGQVSFIDFFVFSLMQSTDIACLSFLQFYAQGQVSCIVINVTLLAKLYWPAFLSQELR